MLWTSSENRRHCLVPCDSEPREAFKVIGNGLTLRVSKNIRLEGRPDCIYYVLECERDELHRIFDYFIHDLASAGVPSARSLLGKIEDYRYFWQRPKTGLSAAAAAGLFGELWFLIHWLNNDLGKGFSSWIGPLGGVHDFSWSLADIEVKTSNRQPARHRIGRLVQLLPQKDKRLYLYSLEIRRGLGLGNYLSDLVSKVAGLLGDEGYRSVFYERVAGLGYRPDDPQNEEYRYIVGQEQFYEVRDDFPRLTMDSFASGIPSGVGGIQYEVTLAGLEHLRLNLGGIDLLGLLGVPDTRL